MIYKICSIAIILLLHLSITFGQDVRIKDSDNNLMMKINDEGSSGGSITLPTLTSVSTPIDKLYNFGGDLYWSGTSLILSNSGNYLRKNVSEFSETSSSDAILRLSNYGTGIGITGRSDNNDGVVGWTNEVTKSGVFGHSALGRGVTGRGDQNDGVVGWTGHTEKSGVFGHSTNGIGVAGKSINKYGVVASSDNSHALYIPNSGENGIDIVQAGKNGVKIYNAQESAVYVEDAGHDGIRVADATWSGVFVQNAGYDALRVLNAGQDGLRIFENVGRYYMYLGADAAYDFIFDRQGIGWADSAWVAVGSDFAELMEVEGSKIEYEEGDVLVISDNEDRAVKVSTIQYSTSVIGIYSSDPGFIGSTHRFGEIVNDEIPVAITGIVPCKVTAQNGSIRRGDLLTTSDIKGHAMKASDPKLGSILGKALENHEIGEGVIEVFVTVH